MIIDITSRCNGGCAHCMSRCTDEGIDMSRQVFEDSVKFVKKLGARVINIGGGEPTIHPEFIPFIEYIRDELRGYVITVCSNGTFVRNLEIYSAIKSLKPIIQITYNKDLYKTDLTDDEIKKLSEIGFVELNEPSRERLVAYGRALDNNLETSTTRISPFCFNMRSLVKHSRMDFFTAVKYFEMNHKFCCPGIKPNGDITLSESLCCPSVGTIYNSNGEVTENIWEFHCAECVYAKKLLDNPIYRASFL
jgi:organic radical activating enzyme